MQIYGFFSISYTFTRYFFIFLPFLPSQTNSKSNSIHFLTILRQFWHKYGSAKGLDTISAISPLSTLISNSTSSIDVERTNFPTFVNCCTSGSRFPFVSLSSVIDLNFITRNIFASLHGRSWKKNAPAPLLAK